MAIANLNSKYYKHISAGGLNEAIRIDGYNNGSVLANCVGFAWGRIYECSGSRPKMGLGDAKSLWNYNDGYAKSQTPSSGDIVIFDGGDYGHVAFVEVVYSNGDIKISESDYFKTGSGFAEKRLTKASGFHYLNGYKLLGFKQTEATIKLKRGTVKYKLHYKLLKTYRFANRPQGQTTMYVVELTSTRDKFDAKTGKRVGRITPQETKNKPLLVWYGGKNKNGHKKHYYEDKGKQYFYFSEDYLK